MSDIRWDIYEQDITAVGDTMRERSIDRTKRSILKRAKRSVGYKTVLIDGKSQNVTISSSTEQYHKKINALPNEHIYAGSIVEWNGVHFIILYVDVEDEIYQRGEMYQCNVFFKWQNAKGDIITTWGFCEDLSMYAAGVTNSAKAMMALEQNLGISIPLNVETAKLRRDKRFLIDVVSDEPLAYVLTNRNAIGKNYTPQMIDYDNPPDHPYGVLGVTMQQTQRSEKDNFELMIADYFEPTIKPVSNCNILYSNKAEIKAGGSAKVFTAQFLDSEGKEIVCTPVWTITVVEQYENDIDIEYEGKTVKIKANNRLGVIGTMVKIQLTNAEHTASNEMYAKVVSIYG